MPYDLPDSGIRLNFNGIPGNLQHKKKDALKASIS